MKRYTALIKSLPETEHAFTTKKEVWSALLSKNSLGADLLPKLFGQYASIEISREDLFNYAQADDLKQFILATILWGYPAGMRGNNFTNIIKQIEKLEDVLKKAKQGNVDWQSHLRVMKDIHGLGISTYTKFLYFLKVEVDSYPALILDKRIVSVLNKGLFSEFSELKDISYINAPVKYPEYLKSMDTVAKELSVPHGSLEMFLFGFGLNLKPRDTKQV